MDKNEIIKLYGTDFKQMTRSLLEAADLRSRIPGKDTLIGIKPNLVSPFPAEFGGTTHPQIVAGIIEYLQENGFQQIRILEGSWVGDSTADAFEICGYRTLTEKYHVPFIDLQKESSQKIDCGGMQIAVTKAALETEFLINVPVLKGHCQTKVTCALKNMKGLLPNTEKRHFHAIGLHDPIAHLNAGIRQDFIVVDHICGDLDFEDGGHPVVHNCIMAALDPVLVDSYACRLLHYTPDDVPYIRKAESLGVGTADLNTAHIHTLNGQDPEGDDARTVDRKIVELMDTVQEVDSCSACYGYLLPALDMLRNDGLLERLKEKIPDRICIGQGWRGKTGSIGIGNCTGRFSFCVKGCPPTEKQIYEALKQYILEQ